MGIAPGTRFDRYEVAEQIGIGGMGIVYRATDTSLKRDVAIKIIPESFVRDADRLARFQREAEVLASLNHSNIAQIYGLEKADGHTVIVMELVEGPTLDHRIAEGPIPPGEALGIARQIADALEAAHGRHIVHRDLKPQNIKLRPDGTIKVLDFGIAKALDAKAISGGPSALTTPAVTETGVILGSAAYMSPEQARGKAVDQRTDIWAFGCVLFEMLTGRQAFGGEDVMLTLARVLDRDTDMSSMPGTISPAVRQTIKLCLEKDPKKRVADIRDVRLALEGAFETALPGGAQMAAKPAARTLPIAAAGAAAVLVGIAVWLLKPPPPPAPEIVTRFSYEFPDGVNLRGALSSVIDIAPNGELFAFNGTDGIYVRAMGDAEARVIPGTGGDVVDVAISPDGREVAYFRNETVPQLVKVAVSGGAPVVLVGIINNPFGLSWGADGTLLFGQSDGIWRVSENGGTPERLIQNEGNEQIYGPQLLPGGEWVLFTLARTVGNNRWNEADIVVESLAGGGRRVLRSGGTDARYLPTGHITYAFENVLFASAFDATNLVLDAERVSLVQGVRTAIPVLGGAAFYAVSNNGTLVYVPGLAGEIAARQLKGLAWVDRGGSAEPIPIRPDDYSTARLSPNGKRIALVVGSTLPRTDPAPDIYIFDVETQNLTQLTFGPAPDDGPVWSRDGSRIFYRSYPDGPSSGAVFSIPADGGAAELLARSPMGQNPLPWAVSNDGRTLLLVDALSLNDVNLATLDIDNADEVTPLINETKSLSEPSLSPNGEWLLYHDFGERGTTEINLRPFPAVRQQRRPVGAGMHPVFSADGSEIFFFDGGGISAASVRYAPVRVGTPEMLFRGQYWYGIGGLEGAFGRAWDVDSSSRFLMITLPLSESDAATRPRINVVLNWSRELEARVPAR